MANQPYTNYLNLQLGGGTHTLPDFDADTIDAVLVDTDQYTFSAAHQDLADIPAGARVLTVEISPGTVANGRVDVADFTFTGSGTESEAVVIYKNTGTETTSTLVVYIDTFTAGMPVTPNGEVEFVVNGQGLLGAP